MSIPFSSTGPWTRPTTSRWWCDTGHHDRDLEQEPHGTQGRDLAHVRPECTVRVGPECDAQCPEHRTLMVLLGERHTCAVPTGDRCATPGESGGCDQSAPRHWAVVGRRLLWLLTVLTLLLVLGRAQARAQYRARYLPRPVPAWDREGTEFRGYTLDQMKDLLQLDADHDLLKKEVERLREINGLRGERLVLEHKERLLDLKLLRLAEDRIKVLDQEKSVVERERNKYKYRPMLAKGWKGPLILGLVAILVAGVSLSN